MYASRPSQVVPTRLAGVRPVATDSRRGMLRHGMLSEGMGCPIHRHQARHAQIPTARRARDSIRILSFLFLRVIPTAHARMSSKKDASVTASSFPIAVLLCVYY